MPSETEKAFLRAAARRRTAESSSRKPQLSFSSWEDGGSNEYDAEGTLVSRVGKQFDGTHTAVSLAGPPPPQPDGFSVTPGPLSVSARWNGTFVDAVSPMDLKQVEVQMATDPAFTDAKTKGEVVGELGTELVILPLPVKPLYFRLVARSQSSKPSVPSETVMVIPLPQVEPGTITETEIADGSITTPKLRADAIDGMQITGTVFQTTNGNLVWSDAGIVISDDDGSTTISLPSNGTAAHVMAELIARSISSLGNASFRGTGNEIASESDMVLSAGVTPPASPPTTANVFESVEFPAPPEPEYKISGLAYADGLWWRAINILGTAIGDRVEGLDATGQIVRSFPITSMDPSFGLTAIDGVLYVLGKELGLGADQAFVEARDAATGALVDQWEYMSYGSGTYAPAIGTDGANILIAQCWANGDTTWRKYLTDGTFALQVDSEYKLSSDLVAIHSGTADFGAQRVVITKSNGTTELFHTAGAQIPYGGWFSAQREDLSGLCWDGNAFRSLSVSNQLVTYTHNWDLGGDTDDWWILNTWADSMGRETPAGPAQRFTLIRRAELLVRTPPIPEAADKARIYLVRSAAEPVAADYGLLAATSTDTARIVDFDTTTAPPANNTFPDSTPARLWSKRGNFRVDGTGAGSWGPLTFHADGTMTSSEEPDWIPITTFESGFGPNSFGFTPAYRVWPSGKVEWKGIIGRDSSAGKQPFTVPADALPPQPVSKVAGANSGIGGICRIEWGPLAAPTMSEVYPDVLADLTWICLDGIYYYLDQP